MNVYVAQNPRYKIEWKLHIFSPLSHDFRMFPVHQRPQTINLSIHQSPVNLDTMPTKCFFFCFFFFNAFHLPKAKTTNIKTENRFYFHFVPRMVESDLIPIRPNLVRDRVRILCDGCIDLKLPSGKSVSGVTLQSSLSQLSSCRAMPSTIWVDISHHIISSLETRKTNFYLNTKLNVTFALGSLFLPYNEKCSLIVPLILYQ